MKNKEQRLIENMKMISVELTDKQVSQFIKFYEMLVEWNKVMNLTGITEYDEVVMKHFVDSLSIVKVNGFDNVTSIIDVGTGAGFPGIQCMYCQFAQSLICMATSPESWMLSSTMI